MSDINDLEYNYLDEQGLTKLVGNLNNKFKPTIRACYEESTALHPHAVGDYIWLETDETVYLVTAAISVGDSIVYGTNITDAELTENSIVGIQNKPGSGGGESGSGGHIIINANGSEMPAESKLQFGEGFSATDDSANGKTIITPNNNIIPTQDELGTVELSSTAAYAHAVGETFIWGGQFVKATAAIAVGDTIAIGTNVSATTVSAILSELNSKSGTFKQVSRIIAPSTSTDWVNVGSYEIKANKVYGLSSTYANTQCRGIGWGKYGISNPTVFHESTEHDISNNIVIYSSSENTTVSIFGKRGSTNSGNEVYYIYELQ